jgi:undecaprenyl-diphosphatase
MSSFNQIVFGWLHHLAGRWPLLDAVAIFCAQWLPYILVLGFLFLILDQADARHGFYLFAEGALAIILARGIITTTIHYFYYHPRPFEVYGFVPLFSEVGSSFPSGHAAWFFALAMVVWYLDRKWGVWYFVFATLISVARIYAGVHWPLDVIAGAIIGVGSAMFVRWVLEKELAQFFT